MKRNSFLRPLLLSLLAVSALATAACKKKPAEGAATEGSGAPAASAAKPAEDTAAKPTPPPADAKSILETAKAAGSFTTLLKAIDAAGLTEKLSGPGPFTVFAPTDDAFAKLPAKDLDALLADKPKLEALLEEHVLAGTLTAKDLGAQKTVKSVQGAELPIDTSSGVKIGGATVTKPDIAATNGVIHVVDTVLAPPK